MSPPTYTASPEHRDSLHEDVEIDITRYSVRTFQRIAAEMVKRQDMHAAEVRRFARGLAVEYLDECERQAREASAAEFRAWLTRRGDIVHSHAKPRASNPRRDGWRQR